VENHGKSTGRMLGFFASINNVNRTYKTGGYEQARNANFRQIDQDVSAELLLLDQNIFTDERIFRESQHQSLK
jgi:hypothetical protein